ncbi:class II aldolase/adducin family protein [Trueperella pyogenes]|uniref:Class II aldolase/adducin family protein n=1 Tax=Trueperella pyogenes TaxID=1661 RepID=A0ABV3NDU0_9ACTO|nr:class II aldolase/adducin family protein [Trueperella pyogenes]AHU89690.1 aldolase [Trueperella pyogenes]AWA43689.1 class II aldolase/adducin family protein [Trueperella pyogenes]AWG03859.1 class II aldolase/adducin family protein [Trueperella pyogenes]AWG16589.1 class II aldolase/adducin family protein [Trueperella pyogenes]AZR01154.1 class II aldolase/adducin family protein [Trueperella pyogenes]
MLESLKKDLCEIAKRAQRDGLCKHKSGNFSIRDQESGLFVVSPTGLDRDLLSTRDVVVMNLDAEVLENESGLRPTSEVLMHIAIYKARPDVTAIVHTHSMYATAMSVLNRPIPAIVYEVANLGLTKARIPVVPYARPGTQTLAEYVSETVHEADCMLLAQHGTVAVDSGNIYEAFLKASYIEELAELYHHTLTANGGKEPVRFDQSELGKWAYPSQITFPNAAR